LSLTNSVNCIITVLTGLVNTVFTIKNPLFFKGVSKPHYSHKTLRIWNAGVVFSYFWSLLMLKSKEMKTNAE
ncbi:hypothetical protein, partial [Virgibacillus sp. DJP39]|uniref:hypothetical protein n=1 Tax=Virgibacillus sp. DJP39 TaxID=3409790 RepID=UPI003BB6FC0E